eukprot:3656254-Pyramimonas_sp.AAC.1
MIDVAWSRWATSVARAGGPSCQKAGTRSDAFVALSFLCSTPQFPPGSGRFSVLYIAFLSDQGTVHVASFGGVPNGVRMEGVRGSRYIADACFADASTTSAP